MKRLLITLLLPLLLSLGQEAKAQDINAIRDAFYQVTLNSAYADSLLQYLQGIEEPSPLIQAYIGATRAINTKTMWNPYSKIVNIKKAAKMINKAVGEDMENLEIRFLRYAVEFHIPGWLMIKKHQGEDGDFLYENLLTFDLSFLTINIIDYIAEFYEINDIYSADHTDMILDRLNSTREQLAGN